MKKILITIATWTLFYNASIFAQQDAMFTHYMYNNLSVNPASAGDKGTPSFTALHRSQWTGYTEAGIGAIETQSINFHTTLKRKELGLGASIINDRIFPVNFTSFQGNVSYRINLSEKKKLSFGLKLCLNNRRGDLSALYLQDQENDDPAFQGGPQSILVPNIGFGSYYTDSSFYAGVSITNLQKNDSYKISIDESRIISEQKHFYFIAGLTKKLSEKFDFKPSTFIKVTAGAPVEMDITGILLYKKSISFGTSFRTGDAIGILAGAYILDNLNVGYAYDWSYSKRDFRFNSGTHEIMVCYDIPPKKSKPRTPKFYHFYN